MSYEESMRFVKAFHDLRAKGDYTFDDLLNLATQALNSDESNYEGYFCYAIAFFEMGANDEGQKMLDKCNELLPPSEAISKVKLFGGKL